MKMYDLIYKKRQGEGLERGEIQFVVNGYTQGTIPQYQVSALLMAIYFRGMDLGETRDLTQAIVESGDKMDLSCIPGLKVDKHSTGGVGDTTTLVLVPLVSAAGVFIAKMSGRSLGHGGGTIDKLESIPGFITQRNNQDFLKQVEEIGAAFMSQTGNLCPADKKLYSLRDLTATVDSIPLIASSIMSKKIAGGADTILLDVKTGSGAFMKDLHGATVLAEMMVGLGKELGKGTMALITNMEEPLGFACGNSLEVKEAIATLKGDGPSDLQELSLRLGANLLFLSGKEKDYATAYRKLEKILYSGYGLEQLMRIIKAQGGDPRVVDDVTLLPSSNYKQEVLARRTGFVTSIDTYGLGLIVRDLGAGRIKSDDEINYGVGVVLEKKVGDRVEEGEILATIFHDHKDHEEVFVKRFLKTIVVEGEKVEKMPLVYKEIDGEGG